MIEVTEDTILKAYQDAAQEQILLLKLEKQHQAIATKIAASRRSLVEKKGVLAELHRDMSAPVMPVFDPKLA